jgi:hypothetical protein
VLALAGTAVSALLTTVESGRLTAGRVYFGTDTRAQELLVGAALAAVLLPAWRRHDSPAAAGPRRRWRAPTALVAGIGGTAGLAAALHWADGSPHQFRHGLMLFLALASAALIGGLVVSPAGPLARVLSTRPIVALGRLSYGIYLWHWPVFEVLDGARTGLGPYPLAGLRLLASLVLAAASLLLVELPVRRARVHPRRLLPAAGLGVAAVLAFTACAAPSGHRSSAPPSALDLPPDTAASRSVTSRAPATSAARTGQTRSSVAGPSAGHSATGEATTGQSSAPRGHDGSLVVDVFGDSIAWTLVHYLPPIPGIRVIDHTILGCGLVDGGPYRYFGQQYTDRAACDRLPARWRAEVRSDRPDEALLVIGRWETMDRRYRGSWTHVGDPGMDAHLTSLLAQAGGALGATGARLVIATEPYNRRGEQPNGQLYPEDDPARVDSWNRLVTGYAASRAGTALVDLNRKLCPAGAFTWQVDGVQVRSDGVHLTPDGVRWLTPWLAGQLRAARP